MTDTQAVAVEQIDRDAAANMLDAYRDRLTPDEQAESAMLAVNIRAGLHDDAPRVQAFARHRIASHALGKAEQREADALIAEKWRDENKAAASKARVSERKRDALGLAHPGMSYMLEGAAIECNAIAVAIRGEAA